MSARVLRTVCPGFASLVGAGPGDPELLTWRAILRLRSADLVLVDGLVPKQLARLAAPRETRVGGQARRSEGAHTSGRVRAHRRRGVAGPARRAAQGRRSVRARPRRRGGGGIGTSRRAVRGRTRRQFGDCRPGTCRDSVTHRGLSSGFLVVSGHAEAAYRPVLGSLPPDTVTVIVLMGSRERAGIRRALEQAGWTGDTPAAVVTNASQPDQRVWIGTLATLDGADAATPRRRSGRHRHRPRGVARDGPSVQPSVRLGGDIMAAIDDPKTLGRARLSFAKESDIDEFADMLGKFERGEITPDQWRGFRLLRGTYGQRQTDDSHMMRLKAPQGMLTADQLYALADVAEQFSRGFGHITTRQNIQLHFVKLTRCRNRDAPHRRGRHDHARGVRQLGAQHHGLCVCRHLGVRAVRRHAVLRDDDAILPAPPAQLVAAAQVQDRLRRVRRGSRQGGHQRHRLARPGRERPPRLPRSRRRRDGDDVRQRSRALRVPAGRGDAERRRGDRARVSRPRRLQAQAQEPDEVPDEVARLGQVARGVRACARPR